MCVLVMVCQVSFQLLSQRLDSLNTPIDTLDLKGSSLFLTTGTLSSPYVGEGGGVRGGGRGVCGGGGGREVEGRGRVCGGGGEGGGGCAEVEGREGGGCAEVEGEDMWRGCQEMLMVTFRTTVGT